MALTGIKLEFHDGTVFRARENIVVRERLQPIYQIDGLRNTVTLYNEYYDDGGQPGRANSNFSGVFYGFGAGVRTWSVELYSYEGATESWGGAASSDSAYTKLQTLGNTLANVRADSRNPAIFETGEYSGSGKYSPVAVAVGETDLPKDFRENPSSFRGTVQLHDAIDLSQAVSARARR